jgi:Acyltransferase family/Ankyrin repeats (3 copies)
MDALRAAAMILGIAYHVSLSFALTFPWMIQDRVQTKGMFLFQAGVHGFRMPLFFLLSGFFTAMLWRSKGLKALVWHRFRRVLLPCLVGLVTVVPFSNWAIGYAFRTSGTGPQNALTTESVESALWASIKNGDVPSLQKQLADGQTLADYHPEFGVTPLTWAGINSQQDMVLHLIDRGAELDGRNTDGGTALHASSFFGNVEIVKLLLERGANVNAKNNNGETPLHNANVDLGAVEFIGGLLGVKVDSSAVPKNREVVRALLTEKGGEYLPAPSAPVNNASNGLLTLINGLTYYPIFSFLWFLWFLWLFVMAFSIYAHVMNWFGWKWSPRWLFLSRYNLLLLVPITMFPVSYMTAQSWMFGPDTSMGILPMWHVFVFYAIFFAFGALYFDCQDTERRLGDSWRWVLPTALLVVFPIGIEFNSGMLGFREYLLPSGFYRGASVFCQALYAWMMAFSCIGMFKSLLTRESKTIRYMSEASYWLYLTHLPLVIIGQAWIKDWNLPAWFKVSLISIVVTGVLLVVYDLMVRYTWIGTFLNGRRRRARAEKIPQPVNVLTPEQSTSA